MDFRNEPDGTIIIFKKDAVTGAAVSGVQFQVTTGSGEFVAIADGAISSNGIYFTDENGQIVLSGLKPDTYVITETATVSGYVLDPTPHVIAVAAGDTQTLTITNQSTSLLLIQKYDRVTRTALAGAEFRIVPADSALAVGNEGLTSPTGLYVTDEDGQVSLENLTPGAYVITETQAPEGYALDSEAQTVVVRSGRTETVRFYDSALTTLQILKRDAVSHQPLVGAEFTVTTADGTRLGDNNGIYTTGEDGTATVTGLQPNMTVIVSEATSPAGYVLNATPQSIIVRSGAVNSLVFNDEPKTTLLVHKYIAGTRNEPLAGVEFKVTNSLGEVQGMNNGIYYTDANGDFMVTGLDPGLTVTVRETKTVDGYVLDGTPQSIQILAGDMQELTFWNQRKGTLIIRKLAEDTGLPLAGAEFHIAYADGRPVDDNNGHTSTGGRYVTDSRGEIVITDVTGVIVVTETATVDGYAIDPTAMTQTVVVNPEDAQTLTFTNPRLQTLTLTKYVTGTTTPIQGARFLLTDGDGAVIGSANGEFTTDRSGQIVVENLIPGTTVTAREISVPDEYVLDATPRTIRVRSGEAQSMVLYNSLKGSLTVRKIDSATGEALSGAQFRVTTATGDAVSGYTGAVGSNGIFTTDRNGEIVLNRLQPGVYTVREVQAPDGYVCDDQPQTVVLDADGARTVTFANAPRGSLIIVKRDALTGALLAGAEFKVTTAAGTLVANNSGRISSNGIYVTDEVGQITLTKLTPGAYVVTETTAPAGYHLSADAQTVEVTADDVQTIRFSDEPLASLTIRKQDILTGAGLADAVFSVKDTEGREIGEYSTGADGNVTVTGLIPGTSVVVTEAKAPSGYVLNDHPRTIAIRSGADNSVTFEDQPTATLLIRKVAADTGEPLSGVSFKVIDGSGQNIGPDDGIFTTDHAGEIRIPGLTPGVTIKVREIEAAPGYVLDPVPQDIEMQAGQVQTLTFRDLRQGSLVIRKLDSATNQPLAGVTFKITTAEGNFVPDASGRLSSNGLYRTDAAGEIILTGIVGTLVVTETETIPGYVIDEATRSQTVVVHPDDTQTLTFFNAPKQSLTVQKYETGTTMPIRGAEFLVTDSHGTVIGQNNGVFVTDENGRFVVTDLEPGITVTVKETKVPAGYVLDGMPKSIAIASGEAQNMSVHNTPTQTLILQKYVSGTTEPIEGVSFHVTDQTGSPIGASNGDFTTDSNGQITLTGLTPGSTVTAVETETVEGFVLDSAPKSILIRAGEVQRLVFFNSYKGSLHVYKIDSVTEQPLADAEFKITTVQGTPVDSYGGRVSTGGIYRTDENGEISVDGLQPGVYTVAETKAPAGYVLDSNPQTVEVHEDDAQYLVFRDTPLQTLVIQKYADGTTRPLPGVTFRLTDADGRNLGEYVTDEAGQIVVDGLEPGAVVVAREIRTVEGYHLNTTPQTIRIGVSGSVSAVEPQRGTLFAAPLSGSAPLSSNSGNALTFYDVPLATLVIHKVVEGTENEPLPGVEFHVTDGTGRAIGSTDGVYVTDERGEITIRNLEIGTTVRVRETKTLPGYVLDAVAKDIEIQSSDLHELTFKNARQGGLTVRKLNSATNEPLAGAEFRIAYADGRPVDNNNGQTSSGGVYTTDSNGEINIAGITGTVVITEERAPAGFSMDAANRSQTVVVNPAETQTVTFYNTPDQSIVLQKYVKGTTTPIQGARFLVTDGDGRTVGENGGEFTTDESGRITVSGLKPGTTITAREVEAAEGYVLDGTPKSVTIRSGSVQQITFYNEPCGTLVVMKRDAVTDAPLAGAVFQVMNSRGEYVASNGGRFTSNGLYTTDENGQIILTGLNPMTVVVKEVEAPDGYTLDDTPQTVEILPDDTQTLTFKDVPLQTLVITKYAEGTTNPLPGVTFLITDAGGNSIGSGEYTTDANGRIVISGLAAGTTVVAREIRTVKGYHLNGVPQTIQIGVTGTSTLNVSGTSGTAVLTGAGTGTAGGNSMTFYDAPLATLVVRKFIDGTENEPLPGVEFKIVDGTGKNLGDSDGVFYTDAQGEIVIENLEIGTTVKVRETKTVDGFVLDGTPKDIEIQSSDLHELVFRNQRQGGLTVRVRDSVTREALAGVVFRIVYADGRPVDDNNGQTSSNSIYTTNANGEINITGLTGTIVVTEQRTIDGYTMNPAGTTQTVVVNPAETQTLDFFDNPNQTLTIQVLASDTNEPLPGIRFLVTDSEGTVVGPSNGEYVSDQNGRITIPNLVPGVTVTAKETASVSGYILNSQPQSIEIRQGEAQSLTFYNDPKGSLTLRLIDAVTEQFLTGGEFRITTVRSEPVDANEGHTSTNGIYRVDEEGRVTVTGLLPGVYTVVQTKAPEGYVLEEEPQTVTINADDAQTLTFRDTPLQTLVVQNYVEGTTTPLVRSEFLVTDGSGSVLGTENGVYRTDDNGRFVVSGLRPGINVHVKQTAVADGYLLNGNPQSIEIRSGEAQSLTFYNQPCGTLVLLARDKETDEPIQGVVFQILNSRGEYVADYGGALTSNGLYTSDEHGQVIIHNLEPAALVVREVEAPSGYVLNTEPQTVEINPADTQTLTFKNVPTTTVVVQKFVQGTTEPLSGVRFLITDGNGANIGSGEYVTDENGRIVLDGIAPGTTVIAREIRTVNGYTLNGSPRTLEVVSGRENVLTFYDEPLSTLILHCYLDGTENEPVANVGFKVVDGSGRSIGPDDGVYYTDHAGNITLIDLEPGVTINARIFKVPAGFVLDGLPQDIVMESGAVQELTFWVQRQGALTVRVLDQLTQEPVPGVEFSVKYADTLWTRPTDSRPARGSISPTATASSV